MIAARRSSQSCRLHLSAHNQLHLNWCPDEQIGQPYCYGHHRLSPENQLCSFAHDSDSWSLHQPARYLIRNYPLECCVCESAGSNVHYPDDQCLLHLFSHLDQHIFDPGLDRVLPSFYYLEQCYSDHNGREPSFWAVSRYCKSLLLNSEI